MNPLLCLPVGIASGVAIGFLNGIITTKIGIPSFITTLGTMMAFRGVVLLASAGFPEAYDQRAARRPGSSPANISGFPVQFLWFIAARHRDLGDPGEPPVRQLDLRHGRQPERLGRHGHLRWTG